MNEKQNRFIVSVATKNVLVLLFKKYSMHALDNDLEVNRNSNKKHNLFN